MPRPAAASIGRSLAPSPTALSAEENKQVENKQGQPLICGAIGNGPVLFIFSGYLRAGQ